jgi:1-acyl-sn-glycerol-3-phosphate acyltransferase
MRRGRFNRWHFALKRLVLRPLYWIFLRLDVEGMHNIPASGPVIVYINHTNWLDPIVAAGVFDREVTIMGKVELFRHPFLGPLLREYGVYPIRRTEGDMGAFKRSLGILHQGGLLIMSPEGTRSYHGRLQEAKPGFMSLAVRAGASIVPMAILGCQPVDANIRRLRRTPVRVIVGEAYLPQAESTRPSREEAERLSREAMVKLAALMPPQYRGVYSEGSPEAASSAAHRGAST